MRDYKAQLGCPADPARIVKPRKPHTKRYPLMVVDHEGKAWFEGKDKHWDVIELVTWLSKNWPRNSEGKQRTVPVIVVVENPQRLLVKLHKYFKDHPEWNFGLRLREGERFHTDGTVHPIKVLAAKDIGIAFFGFRSGDRHTRYFHPVTPHDFFDSFDQWESALPDSVRLYKFGGEVRKWCLKHKLRPSGSRGGLSAQLLRDKRFYSKPRRKVPKLTNEAARPSLPGNHYESTTRNDRVIKRVLAVDQTDAHHYAARTLELPAANSLYARGRFPTKSDKPYARAGRPIFNQLIGEAGLFRLGVYNSHHLQGFLPPWAESFNKRGIRHIWLYSNELDFAKSLGIEIRYISYCFTSAEIDKGLGKYAEWATQEIQNNPDKKVWLKPTLLSAYGMLGVRPRKLKSGYYRSPKGEKTKLNLGATPIEIMQIETKHEVQSPIANVIHRGMIEAEVRKLSILMARRLANEGHNIVAIHADCVMVKDEGNQLPLLPEPWRVKETLTHFKIVDGVSYISDQRKVLPGRRRDIAIAVNL